MRIAGKNEEAPIGVSGTDLQEERLPWTAPVATVMNLRETQLGSTPTGDGCAIS